MSITGGHGYCPKCGKHDYLMPLHGEKGGPLHCLVCCGEWAGRKGKLQRIERVLSRVLRSYYDAGGEEKSLAMLKCNAMLGRGESMAELTSDLLADVLNLTHPDHHPPERRDLAQRTTARLIELKPFVPAPPALNRSIRSRCLAHGNQPRVRQAASRPDRMAQEVGTTTPQHCQARIPIGLEAHTQLPCACFTNVTDSRVAVLRYRRALQA